MALRPTLAAATLLAAALASPDAAAARPDAPLVITQVPRPAPPAPGPEPPAGIPGLDPLPGARLILLAPDGRVTLLSEGFESACDPNVSFDGQRLLFSGRKSPAEPRRVWEMVLADRTLRPVSPPHLDARQPIHASTLFTLDSPEPWFTTVFVAREPALDEAGQPGSASLYSIRLDGTELRRLTFNPGRSLDPFQTWDGRVLYSADRRPQEPASAGNRVSLFAIHIEGADMELYGGETGGPCQRMPCATGSGLVVSVESETPTPDGSGHLACIREDRPHVTHKRLTGDAVGRFRHPAPWRTNTVLVSHRPADGGGTWSIASFDLDRGAVQPVFDDPAYDDVQVALVQPRPRPDGHSTVVKPSADTGTFYGLNCYTADPAREAHLKPGSVQRVRFIEGLPLPNDTGSPGRWPFVPRRLVGEAPVESDGSFNVEVPADTPLLLQTLDAQGLALGTCGWIWVKPKETRGCIGCHEDPERIPENDYVLALRRPSTRLTLPPAQRRSISFRADVAPLLQRHCATAKCHGAPDSPLPLPLAAAPPAPAQLEAAYAALLAPAQGGTPSPAGAPVPGRYVDPGRARTSWLVWQLLGQETTRAWDPPPPKTGLAPRKVRLMPPADHGNPLRPEDIRTVIQWIDLGAPLDSPQPPAPSPSSEPSTKP